jgi:phosphoribosyl 1,2-cyclic phosphate phosphodiesterase
MIGCHCSVCSSRDPRDKRSRCSIVVDYWEDAGQDGAGTPRRVLVDTTPELRLQAVANRIDRIDAVVYTHAHADHIFGLDDLRRYNTILDAPLPLYAAADAMATLNRAFAYAFGPVERTPGALYRPELLPHSIAGPFELYGRTWEPIPLMHGKSIVLGFRIGDFAYCTDCNDIPESSLEMLLADGGLDVLIIDALRPRPHPTHLSFEQALGLIARIKPKRAFFTHLSHDVKHADIERDLPPNVRVLYDGLQIEVGGG